VLISAALSICLVSKGDTVNVAISVLRSMLTARAQSNQLQFLWHQARSTFWSSASEIWFDSLEA
jgi:hypothetical protein